MYTLSLIFYLVKMKITIIYSMSNLIALNFQINFSLIIEGVK